MHSTPTSRPPDHPGQTTSDHRADRIRAAPDIARSNEFHCTHHHHINGQWSISRVERQPRTEYRENLNLLECCDGGRQTTVYAEYFIIDDCADWHKIEHIIYILPYIRCTVFATPHHIHTPTNQYRNQITHRSRPDWTRQERRTDRQTYRMHSSINPYV